MWPCHTHATSHSPSSAWDEATSGPASPTSGQDWCHHLLGVPLCWSRWTSPETRCFSETVLPKCIAKEEKTNCPLWLGGLAGETPIYVTNQEALGFGNFLWSKSTPKMMAGILGTLQSQIFPDTKGPSAEIDSSFLPKIHICFTECSLKKTHKTCLHKFKMSSNVSKPLASSRVQFVPTKMALSEKGNTVKRPDSEDKGDVFCSRHSRFTVTSRNTSRATERQDWGLGSTRAWDLGVTPQKRESSPGVEAFSCCQGGSLRAPSFLGAKIKSIWHLAQGSWGLTLKESLKVLSEHEVLNGSTWHLQMYIKNGFQNCRGD